MVRLSEKEAYGDWTRAHRTRMQYRPGDKVTVGPKYVWDMGEDSGYVKDGHEGPAVVVCVHDDESCDVILGDVKNWHCDDWELHVNRSRLTPRNWGAI